MAHLQELKKIEKSKSGGTGAGNENHNTFMLKFIIVPAEAPTVDTTGSYGSL